MTYASMAQLKVVRSIIDEAAEVSSKPEKTIALSANGAVLAGCLARDPIIELLFRQQMGLICWEGRARPLAAPSGFASLRQPDACGTGESCRGHIERTGRSRRSSAAPLPDAVNTFICRINSFVAASHICVRFGAYRSFEGRKSALNSRGRRSMG